MSLGIGSCQPLLLLAHSLPFGKVTAFFFQIIGRTASRKYWSGTDKVCVWLPPSQDNLFPLLHNRKFRHCLRVSLCRNGISQYSVKHGVFLVSLGHPEIWGSVGESSMSSSSIMCRCSSGEQSLSCPASMTTRVREKKNRSRNRPVRSRSQVQVSGTP
jgi:hypothetical protein